MVTARDVGSRCRARGGVGTDGIPARAVAQPGFNAGSRAGAGPASIARATRNAQTGYPA